MVKEILPPTPPAKQSPTAPVATPVPPPTASKAPPSKPNSYADPFANMAAPATGMERVRQERVEAQALKEKTGVGLTSEGSTVIGQQPRISGRIPKAPMGTTSSGKKLMLSPEWVDTTGFTDKDYSDAFDAHKKLRDDLRSDKGAHPALAIHHNEAMDFYSKERAKARSNPTQAPIKKAEDLVEEHKRLVETLSTGTRKEQKEEAALQSKELKEKKLNKTEAAQPPQVQKKSTGAIDPNWVDHNAAKSYGNTISAKQGDWSPTIGRTSSNKRIGASLESDWHSKFDSKDHNEAGDFHHEQKMKHLSDAASFIQKHSQNNPYFSDPHEVAKRVTDSTSKAKYHEIQANAHYKAALGPK